MHNLTSEEQERAAAHLRRLGVRYLDRGYGFFVYGRYGNWMSPTEVLRKVR